MTSDDRFTVGFEAYLDAGPTELSDRVIWSVRANLSTTRQRRHRLSFRLPRRYPMSSSTKLLVAAGAVLALVVAAGGGLFNAFLTGPATGSSPSPSVPGLSPTPSPTPSPTRSSTIKVPVYPGQSAAPLTAAWDSAGGPPTKLGVPAVAADGRIWVASSVDNGFRILNPDGQLAETWGTSGSGDGQFNFSVGTDNAGAIAFAPDGGFWVADTGNFRIQRFDKDRKFLSKWGRYGSGDGEFIYALDISVDTVGTVYVSDDGRHDIQAFTSDGRYLRSIKPAQFVSTAGEGYVLTNVLPDGRPGLVEYKPDGSYQGGMDMPDLMPVPQDTARDSQSNLLAVGITSTGSASTMVRFEPTGQVLNVWAAGGLAVAVSPAGDIAYVLQPDDATLRRYNIPAP